MRALNHALFGANLGLIVSATAEMPTPLRLAYTAATTGAAVLPDIDSPNSTIARIAGRPGQALARRIDGVCQRVYRATATPADPRRRDGHRGLTHTLAFALGSGLITALLAWFGGGLAITLGLLLFGALARRSLFGRARTPRHLGVRVILPFAVALAMLLFVSAWFPRGTESALVFGSAVTIGVLAHLATDWPTDSGVPLLWPIRIRGQRWFRWRLPRRWALHTGSAAEAPIAVLFTAGALTQLLLGG